MRGLICNLMIRPLDGIMGTVTRLPEPDLFARSSVETTQRMARAAGVSESLARAWAAKEYLPRIGRSYVWGVEDAQKFLADMIEALDEADEAREPA